MKFEPPKPKHKKTLTQSPNLVIFQKSFRPEIKPVSKKYFFPILKQKSFQNLYFLKNETDFVSNYFFCKNETHEIGSMGSEMF